MNETGPQSNFGIADAMILIAATAAALGWLRNPLDWSIAYPNESQMRYYLRLAQLVGTALATTWGLGILAIRFRASHRGGRDGRCRPGVVACAAATAGCLIQFALIMIWHAVRSEPLWPGRDIIEALLDPAATGVVGGWLALGLAGLWKREGTWIDDLGIGVGLSWFVLWVIRLVALCV